MLASYRSFIGSHNFQEHVQIEANLHDQFLENSKKEQDFVDDITKKYGNGTFNPDTGIFTPNK